MSIKILNCSFITDITKDTDIEGRRIKRFKTEHFQSFDKTMNVPFGDILYDFRVHDIHKTLISESYNAEVKSLLNNKKLYLVLDLDHTLLNTIPLANLTLEEEYLKCQANQDHSKGTLFRLDEFGIITKLRPFVHQFLQEANKLFEMCIYSMGSSAYALTMAKILDPENKYFKSRIISKDDFPKRDCKGLDVLRVPENLVLVLDDTEAVWQNHKDNLILMDKYVYFQSSCHNLGYKNCKSLSMLRRDENEFNGVLATILRVLRGVHLDFYESNINSNNLRYDDDRDVRQVLKTVKKDVLKNCKIVFSAIFPRNFLCSDHRLWKMAEELGATCTTELDSGVTHVVSVDRGTEKSVWGVEENKYLVHPRWIEAAYYLWRRQLEHMFPVHQAKPNASTLISNLFSQ